MSTFIRLFLGYSVWLFVLGLGLWRGERPERTVALTHLIAIFVTPVAQAHIITTNPDLGIMSVDLVVMAILLWVALRSDRWWAMFSAAFFLVTIGIHAIKITRPDTSQYVYAPALVFFDYLALYALLAGVIALEVRRHRRRKAFLAA